jgi:hypothetical protein
MMAEFLKAVAGLATGFVILLIGFFVYGILMVGKDDMPFSKRRKAFAYLSAVIIFGLGIWPICVGAIVDNKFLYCMGSWIVILGVIMVAITPKLDKSIEPFIDPNEPLDYGDW